MTVHDFIEYIDNAFDRPHFTSCWIDDTGSGRFTDVGYAEEWWDGCMKPELLRVFGGEPDDRT